jgi:hypothetical protein
MVHAAAVVPCGLSNNFEQCDFAIWPAPSSRCLMFSYIEAAYIRVCGFTTSY